MQPNTEHTQLPPCPKQGFRDARRTSLAHQSGALRFLNHKVGSGTPPPPITPLEVGTLQMVDAQNLMCATCCERLTYFGLAADLHSYLASPGTETGAGPRYFGACGGKRKQRLLNTHGDWRRQLMGVFLGASLTEMNGSQPFAMLLLPFRTAKAVEENRESTAGRPWWVKVRISLLPPPLIVVQTTTSCPLPRAWTRAAFGIFHCPGRSSAANPCVCLLFQRGRQCRNPVFFCRRKHG